MTVAERLREEAVNIGYSVIRNDYVFADIFASPPRDRMVPLAIFTHTPPSYRNAALAVVHAEERHATRIVSEHRALGAPLLFVIEGENIAVWQVRAEMVPRVIARVRQDQLPELFADRREAWSPESIQRGKTIGEYNRQHQLSFVDLGLLPAIEGEIHAKLDLLLNDAMAEAINVRVATNRHVDERSLFRAVFHFLAAKILHDRSNPVSTTWDPDKIETVLHAISRYYQLEPLPVQHGSAEL